MKAVSCTLHTALKFISVLLFVMLLCMMMVSSASASDISSCTHPEESLEFTYCETSADVHTVICKACNTTLENRRHTYDLAASCEAASSKCNKCHDERTIIPALGHNYTDSYINIDANFHSRTCVNGCGTYGLGTVKDATEAHNFTYTSNGDGTHNKKCSLCTYEESNIACSGGTATCTEAAKCEFCEAGYGDLAAHDMADATCTQASHCKNCTYTEGEALGHLWSAESKSNGDGTHSIYCTREGCDEKQEAIPCAYNAESGKGSAATCTEAAVCSTCSSSFGTALGHDMSNYSPVDGALTHTSKCQNTGCSETDTKACTDNSSCLTAYTCECGRVFAQKQHSYSYSSDDSADSITQSCSAGCGHSSVASLNKKSETNVYSGAAIEPYEISYSKEWVQENGKLPSVSYTNNTAVGTATVTMSYDTYSVSQTFEIGKRPLSLVLDKSAFEYSGSEQAPKISLGNIVDGEDVRIKSYIIENSAEQVVPAPSEIGTYEVRITEIEGSDSGNYSLPAESAQFTINPRSIVFTASDYTGVYDGTAHGINLTVTNPSDATVKYKDDGGSFTLDKKEFLCTDGAAKTVEFHISKDTYESKTGSAKVSISKRVLSLSVDKTSFSYTGADQKPTVSVGNIVEGENITVTYKLTNTDGQTVSPVNAGNYVLEVTGINGDTKEYYSLPETVKFSFSITPDAQGPAIEGVGNGETYYTSQRVTVSDNIKLSTVTVNGSAQTISSDGKTASFDLAGNKSATYEIFAEDIAGNKITYTVNMRTVSSLLRGINDKNVIPADLKELSEIEEELEELADNLGPAATEDEVDAIKTAMNNVVFCRQIIEHVNNAKSLIDQLPPASQINPGNSAHRKAYNDASSAYNNLTAYEKTLISNSDVTKLWDVLQVLQRCYITGGDGGWYYKGSSKKLSFSSNGAYSQFSHLEIDGRFVPYNQYGVSIDAYGQTIVTVYSSYLTNLSAQNHSLRMYFVGPNGTAAPTVNYAYFRIYNSSDSPRTGDDSQLGLWSGAALMSMGILASSAVYLSRKKKED